MIHLSSSSKIWLEVVSNKQWGLSDEAWGKERKSCVVPFLCFWFQTNHLLCLTFSLLIVWYCENSGLFLALVSHLQYKYKARMPKLGINFSKSIESHWRRWEGQPHCNPDLPSSPSPIDYTRVSGLQNWIISAAKVRCRRPQMLCQCWIYQDVATG